MTKTHGSSQIRKVALVTGAARGIGLAVAKRFLGEGYRVALLDIEGELLAASVKALNDPANTLALHADVSDENAVAKAFADTQARFGRLDALVNNAGIANFKPVLETTLAEWERIMAVNLTGPFLCTKAAAPLMREHGGGAIVNIASISGMISMPLHAYNPSKAAVISITECLAAEWGPVGVRVNAVSPGYTLTPAVQGAIDRGQRDPSQLANASALQRMIDPREIATVCAFLCSPGASAVTGINVPVDAGLLCGVTWTQYGGMRMPKTNEAA